MSYIDSETENYMQHKIDLEARECELLETFLSNNVQVKAYGKTPDELNKKLAQLEEALSFLHHEGFLNEHETLTVGAVFDELRVIIDQIEEIK